MSHTRCVTSQVLFVSDATSQVLLAVCRGCPYALQTLVPPELLDLPEADRWCAPTAEQVCREWCEGMSVDPSKVRVKTYILYRTAHTAVHTTVHTTVTRMV